jgi:hypothetical protein
MNPETAKTLIAQRHEELAQATASRKSGPSRRLFPRWHVSWTRTVLAPMSPVGPMTPAARRGSSVVIIISAHRSA